MVHAGYAAANTYQQSQVSSADPVDLIVMLYDGALVRVRHARQEMGKGNHLAAGISLYRALAILAELRKSLNPEAGGEVAENLDRLYLFMHEELVKGNLERKPDRLEHVQRILADLRDAWEQVAKQAKMSAVAETPTGRTSPAGAAYLSAPVSPGLAVKA